MEIKRDAYLKQLSIILLFLLYAVCDCVRWKVKTEVRKDG